MNQQSQTWIVQQAIQEHCFHPSGEWTEFPQSAVEGSVVARFEEMVARYPNQTAVKMGDVQLTYAELNRAANQVAHALLAHCGLTVEPVALVMRLHIDALIAILGILKAGKLYTAPDLQHPAERIRQMFANAQPALVITQEEQRTLAQELVETETGILTVAELTDADMSDANPNLPLGPDTLLSITYTSGTTGQPKGIYWNHRAVLQRIHRYVNQVRFSDQDRTIFTRYPGFLPRDLFSPLLIGNTLLLFDLQRSDLAQLTHWMAQENVTFLPLALSTLRRFLAQLDDHHRLPHLRYLTAGSEPLQKADIKLFQQTCAPGCILSGEYGMTETLGGFQSYRVDHETVLTGDCVPAGYSQEGFEVWIVDERGNQLPPESVGEIVVRSPYLAQGYWRQPELTAARFRPDPTDATQRLYFTGDLGMLHPDGCLIHLGRKDDQLKIRGYLVEPVEVERALVALGHYREVVVDARPNRHGEPTLVAWLVGGHSSPPVTEVRRQLTRTLPDYMIPTHFVLVDELPLTPANKVDRKALPDPIPARPPLATPLRAPTTPLECWLVHCWEEVLGIQTIGIDDVFFELGGDSLQAMRIITRLHEELHEYLYVAPLFEAPTVAQFAARLAADYPRQIVQRFGPASVSAERTTGDNRSLLEENGPSDDFPAQFTQLRQHFTTLRTGAVPASPQKNPPAVFVLAPGRSGTTLLRVMLGGHPQLFAPPELFLLNYDTVAAWQAAARDGRGYRREGVLQALMQIHAIDLAAAEALVERYVAAGATTQQLYHHIQEAIAPRLLVDKTPAYVHAVETLCMAEQEFDQPYYIHLLRHPYGVIQSFDEVRFAQRNPLVRELGITAQRYAELNWLIAQQNILTFLQEIPAQRQQRLSFEELVTKPQRVMASLCAFLDIDFDERMVQPYHDSRARMTDGIHAQTTMAGDPKFHTHSAIDPTVADRWREAYTGDFLSEKTWEVAESLGYRQAELPKATRWSSAASADRLQPCSDQTETQLGETGVVPKPHLAFTNLSTIQRVAVEQLIQQFADPSLPEWWRAEIRTWGWHRRRKAIHVALSTPPYPVMRRALAQFSRLPWLRERCFRKEERLTRQFLTEINHCHVDEAALIAKCMYMNYLNYYDIKAAHTDTAMPIGWELVEAAQADQRGILFLSMHDTLFNKFTWGLLAEAFRIGGLHNYLAHYQIHQPEVEQVAFSHQLQAAHRVLQAGGSARIAADGHRGQTGIEVNFHGRRRIFRCSFAELAVMTGATVIAVLGAVDQTGQTRVRLAGPLDAGEESLPDIERIKRLMMAYIAILSRVWSETPWLVPWYQMERHLAYPPIRSEKRM